jgi:hypothetical protein
MADPTSSQSERRARVRPHRDEKLNPSATLYVAKANFTFNGRAYEVGEVFEPAEASNARLTALISSRKISHIYPESAVRAAQPTKTADAPAEGSPATAGGSPPPRPLASAAGDPEPFQKYPGPGGSLGPRGAPRRATSGAAGSPRSPGRGDHTR